MGTQSHGGSTPTESAVEPASAATTQPAPASDKPRPGLRLFGIDVSADKLHTFAIHFEQRSISVTIASPVAHLTQNGHLVNACAVAMTSRAIAALKALPQFAEGHGLSFGLGTEQQALSVPDLDINFLLDECADAQVREAVDKTVPLLSGRVTLRHRIPIVTRVTLDTGTVTLNALSVNVGWGGMAVRLRRATELPQRLRVTWTLQGRQSISLDANPRWNSGRMVGLQYLSTAPNALKRWIRSYSTRLGVTPVTRQR